MKACWSDELRIMLHPAATYRRLAARADGGGVWSLLRRPLFVALVVGSFASFTVSGRLTISLLFDGMLFWGFVPVLQALLMSGTVLIFARGRMPMSKAVDFFFMGHGPWLLWLLGIAGTCLIFPLKQLHLWPTEWGWLLPISLLGAWAWSNATSFGFLRGALNLTAPRAATALLFYTALFWGLILSYLFAAESLQLHRLGF